MKKTKLYKNVFFRPEHISAFGAAFRARLGGESSNKLKLFMHVDLGDERWDHDDQEEFFSDLRRGIVRYSYSVHDLKSSSLEISRTSWETTISVSAPERKSVQALFDLIENHVQDATLPPEPEVESSGKEEGPQVNVFIGHGRNPLWRELKDHLQDKHDISVIAYEVGERAGHTIRDILEQMMDSTSIAFLVMTGEDETSDGGLRARQNVIHEIGLFQGRLGFAKGIVLMEQGVEEFSNIHGVQQIRFSKGAIKETFGDVLAVIRREFAGNVA